MLESSDNKVKKCYYKVPEKFGINKKVIVKILAKI